MISYVEKGVGLHDKIRALGHWLKRENGKWISSDDAVVQLIIDSFDPVAELVEPTVAAMKAEAQARIYAIMPAWKQTNTLALGLQNTMQFGPDPAKWPPEMQAIAAIANEAWSRIEAIRSASDAIEAKLRAETKWEALADYDPTADKTWPK